MLCWCKQYDSLPGVKQSPEQSLLSLSLLKHSFRTCVFIQSKQSAQLMARRRQQLRQTQHIKPSLNFTLLPASYSNAWLGGLPTVISVSRHCSGKLSSKGISPLGILSIKDCLCWLSTCLSSSLCLNSIFKSPCHLENRLKSLTIGGIMREDVAKKLKASNRIITEFKCKRKKPNPQKSLLGAPKKMQICIQVWCLALFFTDLPFQVTWLSWFCKKGFSKAVMGVDPTSMQHIYLQRGF